MAVDIPSRIGRYEITRAIGRGGMGRVFLATDTLLERDVALKVLLEAVTPDAAARLVAEARSASHLNHPSICQVYDAGESDVGPWIAMEFVPGDSLGRRIPPGGLPLETVVRLGIEIAGALHHAHGRGIVHRDLKPANIISSDDSGVKVLDFGLARRASGAVQDLTTITAEELDESISGTPAYMPPEVIRGGEADARSDLWAFGVVLYEMAAGTRPFGGSSSFELISAILTDPPKPLPASVPEPVAAVVYRLLNKDPAKRYQSAAEVIAALDVLRSGTSSVPAATHTPTPKSRGRVAAIGAGVALLVLVFVALIMWPQDALTLTGIQPLSGPEAPQSMPTLSPDGSQLAFVSPDEHGVAQVWVRTLAEPNAVQLTSGSAPVARPRWHPGGGSIIYALRDEGIWTIAPVGGAPRRLVESGTNPNLSHDGRWLTWEAGQDIWIAEADGTNARRVDGVPRRYYSVPRLPSVSPDGSRIVYFQAELGPNGDFWRIPSAGGTPERLTSDLRMGGASVWTPNGEWIVFSSARAGARSLWQLPTAGGEPQPLTTGAGDDDWPAISADGSRIVFTNVRNSWELRIKDPAGDERTLLQRPTEVLFPRFSPDGSRIAFFGSSGFDVAISTINADGTGERKLTGNRELNHMPRWSADGRSVVFYQSAPEVALRQVPAVGGAATTVLPFRWERQNAVEFSPDGKQVLYSIQSPNLDEEVTVLRDLETGRERAFEKPHLHNARFSRDGTTVAGTRHTDHVVLCRPADLRCEPVAPTDWLSPVAWSGDDTQIYFLRNADRAAPQQLWSVEIETGVEHAHGEIGPFRGIDRFFDVSPSGEIVWAPYASGRSELWTATIR